MTTGDGTVLDVTLPADARAGEKICAQYLAPVAKPTPFVLEQVLWLGVNDCLIYQHRRRGHAAERSRTAVPYW